MAHPALEPAIDAARYVSFKRVGRYTFCHLDFTTLHAAADARAVLRELQPMMQREGREAPLRVFSDVAGLEMSLAVVSALEDFARANLGVVERSAVVGLTPLQRVALRQIRRLTGRDIREFATRDEAMAYLRD
jgi:hypothetical protein